MIKGSNKGFYILHGSTWFYEALQRYNSRCPHFSQHIDIYIYISIICQPKTLQSQKVSTSNALASGTTSMWNLAFRTTTSIFHDRPNPEVFKGTGSSWCWMCHPSQCSKVRSTVLRPHAFRVPKAAKLHSSGAVEKLATPSGWSSRLLYHSQHIAWHDRLSGERNSNDTMRVVGLWS